ncbi:cytochrome P450 [Streptomyces sp. NPDC090053]|uniref:cytochrome P450 n=1 Tax=Streptomyces sp. NPDC090053 TaxID=3365932 RepID=UPI0037FD4090
MLFEELPPFDLRGWPAEAIADPYPVYLRYRARSPVHHVPGLPGEPDTYYVFGYDEVVQVLTSPRFGRSADAANTEPSVASSGCPTAPRPADRHETLRTMLRNWLVFLDPPRHTTLRALLSKEFTPRIVLGLRERMQEIARELLAEMRRKEVVDLVAEFTAPFPVMVICELLGVERRHCDWLRELSVQLQEASTSRAGSGTDGLVRADAAARQLVEFFRDHARRRHGGDAEDLVSLLVRAGEHGEPLTDDEIAATCVHLLTAGHETTTHALAKSALALLDRPDTLAELCTAEQLLPGAVQELVRFDPPVQAVSRWAYQEEALGGHRIRRGAKIVLMLGSANRDACHFPHPDVLDVHRPPDRHLGFGLGIHFCLGAALARTEVETGLAALLEFLPGASPTGPGVRYTDDLVFHGPAELWLDTGARPGNRAGVPLGVRSNSVRPDVTGGARPSG